MLLLTSCQFGTTSKEHNASNQHITHQALTEKKVIMIILDSLMASSVDKSIEEGDIPGLQFLIDRGQYDKQLVTSFPSMSVTIESSLITGEMADKHKIPGLSWYDKNEDRIVNYGTDWRYWLRNGLSQGLYDVLYNLNNKHLSKDVSTIFEDLENEGFSTGTINTLLYRGNSQHELTIPPLINTVIDIPNTILTKGPSSLTFGRLIRPRILANETYSDGAFHRFGLEDQYSMEITKDLIENDDQPDFLMIFLPDNDKKTHKHSPHYRRGLEKADKEIQYLLNSYDTWDAALEENIFIVIGDHGQDKLVENEEELTINLEEIFADHSMAYLGDPVSNGSMAFGVNQRMAYVYNVHGSKTLQEIAEQSLLDTRIDIAAWQEGDSVNVISPDHDGIFKFKRNGAWVDRYHQNWTLTGNENILTIDLNNTTNEIAYVDYPDVLNHIYTALNSHDASKIILAAKPGYSFYSKGIPTHPDGGEHGGLHKNDILTSIVIAGTEKQPKYYRILELKDFIYDLFIHANEG